MDSCLSNIEIQSSAFNMGNYFISSRFFVYTVRVWAFTCSRKPQRTETSYNFFWRSFPVFIECVSNICMLKADVSSWEIEFFAAKIQKYKTIASEFLLTMLFLREVVKFSIFYMSRINWSYWESHSGKCEHLFECKKGNREITRNKVVLFL